MISCNTTYWVAPFLLKLIILLISIPSSSIHNLYALSIRSSPAMDSSDEKPMKKRRSSSDDDEHQPPPATNSSIQSLPQEIMADMISRLPITSLVQFSFACKSFKQLSRDPHLVNLHLSRTHAADPCLIFHTDYPLRNQLCFVQNLHDETQKARRINIPFAASMPEFSVVGSCNGLLCLSDSLLNQSLCVYNPFTGDYKVLPRFMEFEEQQVVIGFGFHPVTKDYKVIRIVMYTNTYQGQVAVSPYQRRIGLRRYDRSNVQVFSLASNLWRSIGKTPYLIAPKSSSVVLNGRWHCLSRLGRDRMILSFDLADEQFREVQKPQFAPYPARFCSYHLVVLRDCLGVAFTTPPSYGGTLEIWAMKVYDVKESWVKEYTIASLCPPLRLFSYQDLTPYAIWTNVRFGRAFTVLCVLKNGEILIEYKNGGLVSYDPQTGTFKNLTFQGLPKLCKAIVHVGSLNWPDR
ncbi:F-box protein At3g07870-like isoform X2 [Ipomoea triloba]|uniref:F-box protein At3g07870-like isoform X2 n=1 Tax=Ipomoea triloba TaxID=35885 RepID=UPI00125DC8F7|nr:F-box protein At3g07870-like isoform X2 [Ipomoea triloba]